MSVATNLVEGDAGFLDSILDQLCAFSDEAAVKEGKATGNSISKLSTLKQIARKMDFIVGIPKRDMIIALRNAMLRATVPRLVNLVLGHPDALQRSSALATRQDLDNKEVNGSRLIWVIVAEEFMEVWRNCYRLRYIYVHTCTHVRTKHTRITFLFLTVHTMFLSIDHDCFLRALVTI